MTTKFAGAALAACSVLCALPAHASGFYFGDNGTKPMLMGGAFAGQADDLTALDYNPAGLAKQDSLSVLVDMDLLIQNISFHRQDPGFDPDNPSTLTNVIGATGVQPLPFFGLGYGFKVAGRNLTIAAGLYGPPAVGKLTYPQPNYEKDGTGKYLESPRKFAPHRYGLLTNDIIVFFPSLGAAYDFDKYIQVGAVFQLVVSTFKFSQVVYSGLSTPSRIADEDPFYDNLASVDLTGDLTATSVLGVMIRPIDELSFGVSVRPELPIMARGKMDIQQGEAAKSLGATVTDSKGVECSAGGACNANFPVVLPLEIRVGASVHPIPMLTFNADFVYQGWSALKEFVLYPQGVELNIGSNPPQRLADIHSPKKWYDTYSGRFGAAVNLGRWIPVTLHAGFLYETGAMPDSLINLDFMNFSRVFLSGGVTVALKWFDIVAGAYGTPEQTKVVQHGDLLQGTSDATVQGNAVGVGIYKTGGVGFSLGLRFNLGENRKQAQAKVKGESIAVPMPAPATGGEL